MAEHCKIWSWKAFLWELMMRMKAAIFCYGMPSKVSHKYLYLAEMPLMFYVLKYKWSFYVGQHVLELLTKINDHARSHYELFFCSPNPQFPDCLWRSVNPLSWQLIPKASSPSPHWRTGITHQQAGPLLRGRDEEEHAVSIPHDNVYFRIF